MSRFIEGDRPARMHLAQDTTCKFCEADCYWQEVIAGDGTPKVRLFENGKPHVCRPSSDDFEAAP